VSLSVHAGEIVALYGLVGAGRTELARCIGGLAKITAGTMLLDGEPVRVRNPYDALRHHALGYVSEDRKAEGLILRRSTGRNVGITVWDKVRHRLGWLSEKRTRPAVEDPVERLGVKMQGLYQPVSGLSGGHQQKVSAAILLISSDLREVVRLADRILVMGSFRLLGEVESSGDHPSVIGLADGAGEEYERLHRAVPPGVLDAIRRARITSYSIFRHDSLLFAYYEHEGGDLAADLAEMADDEVVGQGRSPATDAALERCRAVVGGDG
jgi:L-rhamnose mutarotase